MYNHFSKYAIYTFLILVTGCTGIVLHQELILNDKDWVMTGGSPTQQNVALSVVSPPLSLLWSYNCDAGIGYLSMSAADAVLFVNTLQGEMMSIDISSGGRLGRLNFLGKEANTTPMINRNNVILAFAGDDKHSLLSYDLLNEAITWRTNLGCLQTSPVSKDDYIYVGSLDGNEYKIRKLDGGIAWSCNVRSPIHSTCCITDAYIIFGADNGYLYCLNINSGTEKWKYKTGESIFTTPLAFDNQVFAGSYDSIYYCIDLSNGQPKWSRNMGTKILSGSTLFNAKAVIFGGIDGNLYSLNVADGTVNWSYHTKGVITSTPVTSGSNIYFSSFDQNVYCVNGSDGKMIWNYTLDGKGKASPIVWHDFLFAADDNNVYCFTKAK